MNFLRKPECPNPDCWMRQLKTCSKSMRRGWLNKLSFLFARNRDFALRGEFLFLRRKRNQKAAGVSSEQTTAFRLGLQCRLPRPRGRDESVQRGDCLPSPARSVCRIDLLLAPLPLSVRTLGHSALFQRCAGGVRKLGGLADAEPLAQLGRTRRGHGRVQTVCVWYDQGLSPGAIAQTIREGRRKGISTLRQCAPVVLRGSRGQGIANSGGTP